MKNIRNFIVDFGGVLYEINIDNAEKEFIKFSNNPKIINDLAIRENLDKIIKNYERGQISSKVFRVQTRTILGLSCSDIEFDNAWNSILLAPRIDAINNIKALRTIGKVALLSNTNEIHLKKFFPECIELFEEMNYLFFSYKIELSKPDIKIFQYVIDNTNFDVNETLFIDDSSCNIDSAEHYGLQTIKIDNYNLSKHIERLSK